MIETARLTLRPCREADKPAFFTLLNTPMMMARLSGVKDRATIDALVDKRIADQARFGMSYWAVERRDSGALIGTCGVRIAHDYPGTPVAGMCEAGWRIGERYWGQGYAGEAAAASFAWVWANTGIPSIVAFTTQANRRSWGLMGRLGMTRRPDLDFHRSGHAPDDPAAALQVHAIERPR